MGPSAWIGRFRFRAGRSKAILLTQAVTGGGLQLPLNPEPVRHAEAHLHVVGEFVVVRVERDGAHGERLVLYDLMNAFGDREAVTAVGNVGVASVVSLAFRIEDDLIRLRGYLLGSKDEPGALAASGDVLSSCSCPGSGRSRLV